MNYEQEGKFIYGAYRHGIADMDLENWMADDLGVSRLKPGDDLASAKLMSSFFAKYSDKERLQENFENLVSTLENRKS